MTRLKSDIIWYVKMKSDRNVIKVLLISSIVFFFLYVCRRLLYCCLTEDDFMFSRTRRASLLISRDWFLRVNNWKMAELLPITTSKRSQLFTWSSGLGEALWSRWRLSQEKKLKLILSQLILLSGSRKGLRKKKEFLLCSKGIHFISFSSKL